MWNVQSPAGKNRLAPPIRYGVVPGGARQEGDLIPLAGHSGFVTRVFRLEVHFPDNVSVLAGEQRF